MCRPPFLPAEDVTLSRPPGPELGRTGTVRLGKEELFSIVGVLTSSFCPRTPLKKNCDRQACWNLVNFTKSSKSRKPSASESNVAIKLGMDLSNAAM